VESQFRSKRYRYDDVWMILECKHQDTLENRVLPWLRLVRPRGQWATLADFRNRLVDKNRNPRFDTFQAEIVTK